MRRLNLVPGRARTKHRFQKLSSCKPHHATKSSKIRHVNIAPRIYRMTASPTISSTRRTIERRSSESPARLLRKDFSAAARQVFQRYCGVEGGLLLPGCKRAARGIFPYYAPHGQSAGRSRVSGSLFSLNFGGLAGPRLLGEERKLPDTLNAGTT
jgi:hypothetical protein